MKRKFTVTILIAVLALAAVFVTACGGKESGVTLVDFPPTATEEAQKLGSVYQLRRTVSDEDGNEYNLTAEVKTSAGAVVSDVINASFELTDIGGYTITYTVTVAEGDVRTSVVTVPCYDDTPPVINIGTPADGVVGELYTLPAITFSDLDAVSDRSVTVYLVADDGTLTEVEGLTETEGTYTFKPTAAGTYRISAYAKDSSGNEVTRTSDFIVDILLEGEVFNPEYSGARDQLSTNKDPNTQYTFVSAEDNKDETYGGAYWLVEPAVTGGVETHLDPRLDVSEYAKYDVITFWLYVESTGTPGEFRLAMLNELTAQQPVMTKEWVCLELDVDTFVAKVGSQYFYYISYGTFTGVRIGEVMGRYTVDYTVTDPVVTTITDDPAEVTFSVSGSEPADVPYTVTVTSDKTGDVVDTFTADAGSYTYSISDPGDYTLTVAPEQEVYYGAVTKQFTVLRDKRIEVDGSYPAVIEAGEPLALLSAEVVSKGAPTQDVVVCKVYTEEEGEWVEVTESVGDTYTPATTGRVKVEYTFDNLDPVAFEMDVARRGEIFDPAYEGALSQMVLSQTSAEPTFVPDAENEDATYGGAYWEITYSGSWCDMSKLLPRLDWSAYEKYDVITFWAYVETKETGLPEIAMFNDGAHKQIVSPNTWTLCEVDLDKFIENANQQYFCSLDFRKGARKLRIGEIMARYAVSYTVADLEVGTVDTEAGTPATVTFSVTAAPEVPYTVTVTDAAGEVVAPASSEAGKYTYSIAELGDYTITVAPENEAYYGTVTETFTVKRDMRIEVNGKYPTIIEADVPLTLLSAEVISKGSPTEDAVVRKVYSRIDEEWVDVTDDVVGDAYTPAAAGRIKVEYTFEELDPVVFELTVARRGEVFDPAASYAGDQISASGGAFTGTVKTFVSAEDNTDETYGGAYWQFTVPGTDWAGIKLTPTFDVADYAKYDYVTVWVYIGQQEGAAEGVVALPFGNSSHHKRKIMTGAWTRVVLVKPYDGMTGATADNIFYTNFNSGNAEKAHSFEFNNFITANWAAQNEFVRIGEITGHTFDESEAETITLFDPSAENAAASVGQNVTSGTINTTDAVNPDPDGGYSGAVVQWTPPASGWANFYLRPMTGVATDYVGYVRAKVWIYIKTADGTSVDFEMYMFNDAKARQKIKTDTWVEMTLDAGMYFDYVQGNSGNSSNPYFVSSNAWGDVELYFGTMTAVTYTENA